MIPVTGWPRCASMQRGEAARRRRRATDGTGRWVRDDTHETRRSRRRDDAGTDPAPTNFLNRELSWLEFNARVLHEAFDERNPLLERLKFLAIFSSNLDEFYMVRVAGLRRQVAARVQQTPPDGLTAREQLTRSSGRVSGAARRGAGLPARASCCRRWPPTASASSRWPISRRREWLTDRRVLRVAGVPGAHAARRRSRAPVPVHLEPFAVARGRDARPGARAPSISRA